METTKEPGINVQALGMATKKSCHHEQWGSIKKSKIW
jgi:hypothetical protein